MQDETITLDEYISILNKHAVHGLQTGTMEIVCANSKEFIVMSEPYRSKDCDETRSQNKCIHDWIE